MENNFEKNGSDRLKVRRERLREVEKHRREFEEILSTSTTAKEAKRELSEKLYGLNIRYLSVNVRELKTRMKAEIVFDFTNNIKFEITTPFRRFGQDYGSEEPGANYSAHWEGDAGEELNGAESHFSGERVGGDAEEEVLSQKNAYEYDENGGITLSEVERDALRAANRHERFSRMNVKVSEMKEGDVVVDAEEGNISRPLEVLGFVDSDPDSWTDEEWTSYYSYMGKPGLRNDINTGRYRVIHFQEGGSPNYSRFYSHISKGSTVKILRPIV